MNSILFIYNPNAGKGSINGVLSEIIQLLSKNGNTVSLLPTQRNKNVLTHLPLSFYQYSHILVSGGDGTLNNFVEAIMEIPKVLRPVCSYLPAGTVNDFASSLSIPKDPLKAIKLLFDTPIYFPYDIGSINDRYFTYIAGFGAFTEVSYETPQASKNLLGKMAYVLNGVKRLPNLKTYQITASSKTHTITDNIIYGMVCNTYSVGGFMKFQGPSIDLADGKFEVVLVKAPKTLADLNQLLFDLTTKNINSPHLYCFRTNHLHLVCEEEIPWTVDGEFGGSYREADIYNHQKALTFLIPQKP